MMRRALLIAVAILTGALLPAIGCWAAVGGELADLEGYAAQHPEDGEARRRLARAYTDRGFVEEAVAQYLAVLAVDRNDAEAAAALDHLTQQQMPAWLPAGAEAAPFVRVVAQAPGGRTRRILLTAPTEAPEGARRDRVHRWLYRRVLCGYVWNDGRDRWSLAARAHFTGDNEKLAQAALQAVLVLEWVAQDRLKMDPAHTPPPPLDLWLAQDGPPGAQSMGRDIYLYAVGTERAPEEWLREVAHECGHAALRGLGGFTKTDDSWADGELGELLFVKWLAEAPPESFPWSVAAAEAQARPQREALLAAAVKPNAKLLTGTDARARDHLVGLALRVEAKAGPAFLGEVLSRCPRGNASQFVRAAEAVAKARGVKVW